MDAKDKNFARDVKNKLTNWGYSFIYSTKEVKITRAPTTAKEKLSELLQRQFDLDIKTDCYQFAVFFVFLKEDIDGFASMPWKEREVVFNQKTGFNISERTLKRWGAKLIDKKIFEKEKALADYWKTFEDGSRFLMDESEIDEAYFGYWREYRDFVKQGNSKSASMYAMWNKYGYKPYKCPRFMNHFTGENKEDLELMIDLVYEIKDGAPGTAIEVITRLIDVPL